ncbi:MAG: helix-turn-helix transcriptional regulator [Rhodococcus sp.]|nr:helix-turn-helix transcriptional regulator [Rhodococcus sp. (in: high G+C Gram-positive bacteria)]
MELSRPTISHHLRVLREAGLLDCERRGTRVYYRVIPSAPAQLSAVLSSEPGVVESRNRPADLSLHLDSDSAARHVHEP